VTRRLLRLFLDSNVLVSGIVSPWGLDKAVLSLCAARICRLVLGEAVRDEVEEALLVQKRALRAAEAKPIIEDYRLLIAFMEPEVVPYPESDRVQSNRYLIRHLADVPVLLSAMEARPDWLLTHNTKHFSKTVAQQTGLRIATPAEFFQTLTSLFE
jgi:predicted nucleic acid-binding protein